MKGTGPPQPTDRRESFTSPRVKGFHFVDGLTTPARDCSGQQAQQQAGPRFTLAPPDPQNADQIRLAHIHVVVTASSRGMLLTENPPHPHGEQEARYDLRAVVSGPSAFDLLHRVTDDLLIPPVLVSPLAAAFIK